MPEKCSECKIIFQIQPRISMVVLVWITENVSNIKGRRFSDRLIIIKCLFYYSSVYFLVYRRGQVVHTLMK